MKVPVYGKKSGRQYDKEVYCFYCEKKLKSKIRIHYTRKHGDQANVKELISCTDKRKKDDLALNLVYLGNYKHNIKVAQQCSQ